MLMYMTKTLYESKARFVEVDSTFQFFMDTILQAIDTGIFKKRHTLKDRTNVLFATSVVGFEEDTDTPTLARVEMNRRGVLRDFLGIDWDFEIGENDKLKKVLKGCARLATEHAMPILFYPTYSFPQKPRGRTVIFVDKLIGQKEYAKAVQYIIDEIGIESGDDGNYSIKHNFNLPVINNQDQLNATRLILPNNQSVRVRDLIARVDDGRYRIDYSRIDMDPQDFKKLKSGAWATTELPSSKKKFSDNGRPIVSNVVADFERYARDDDTVDKAIEILLMKSDPTYDPSDYPVEERMSAIDLSDYNQFFQFLHSLARTQLIGAITKDQVVKILIEVARGNDEWKANNIADYEIEYERVKGSKQKLEWARPFSYYVGEVWS